MSEQPTNPPTCGYREWLEDDEVLPSGAVCGKPAKWLSCTPIINQPVCDEHRCRCRKPIAAQPTPSGFPPDDPGGWRHKFRMLRDAVMGGPHVGDSGFDHVLRVATELRMGQEKTSAEGAGKPAPGLMAEPHRRDGEEEPRPAPSPEAHTSDALPWPEWPEIKDALTDAGVCSLWDLAESGDMPKSVAYTMKLAALELREGRERMRAWRVAHPDWFAAATGEELRTANARPAMPTALLVLAFAEGIHRETGVTLDEMVLPQRVYDILADEVGRHTPYVDGTHADLSPGLLALGETTVKRMADATTKEKP